MQNGNQFIEVRCHIFTEVFTNRAVHMFMFFRKVDTGTMICYGSCNDTEHFNEK
jgi:hypothetical protein